jgi:transcriptional regulator with XRE-family HTH domain
VVEHFIRNERVVGSNPIVGSSSTFKARKANKMTLQQLSDLSGINISNLWFLENGQRNAHIISLKSIADVLKVDVREFI